MKNHCYLTNNLPQQPIFNHEGISAIENFRPGKRRLGRWKMFNLGKGYFWGMPTFENFDLCLKRFDFWGEDANF